MNADEDVGAPVLALQFLLTLSYFMDDGSIVDDPIY